ncbi:unnamed protein product, partial [Allacma fusca]
YDRVLNTSAVINKEQLAQLAIHGIPDECNYRSKVWRILLNYLPPNKSEWDAILMKKRETYAQFL